MNAQGAATATVSGVVLDQRNALPISGATIVVSQNGKPVASTTTNGFGHYTISGITPGVYSVFVSAPGYDASSNTDIAFLGGETLTLDASLLLSPTSAQTGLTVIGHTSTSTNALAAATTISQSISVEDLTRTGQIRIGDQLATLPGVNFSTEFVGRRRRRASTCAASGRTKRLDLLDGHPSGRSASAAAASTSRSDRRSA